MINLAELKTRKLTEGEAGTIGPNTEKQSIVNWLTEQLSTPDEREPGKKRTLNIGEGIEIGPFETKEAAQNFFNFYGSRASRQAGWGPVEGRPNTIRARASVRDKDGKYYLWIVRKS